MFIEIKFKFFDMKKIVIPFLFFAFTNIFGQSNISIVKNYFGCYKELYKTNDELFSDLHIIKQMGFKYIILYTHGVQDDYTINELRQIADSGLYAIVQVISVDHANWLFSQ